jgi:hypothetical protein
MAKQRITRKQIKQDEFREGVESAAEWIERNARSVVIAAVVLVVVVIVFFAVRWYMASGRDEAARSLARGQAAYNAQVVPPEQARPEDPYDPSFGTDEERLTRSIDQFRQAADSMFAAGPETARLYEALAKAEAGERAEARALLDALEPRVQGEATLAALTAGLAARLALEDSDWEQAEARYRALVEGDTGYPRPLAQLGLAQALAGAGRVDEARAVFRDIEHAEAGTPLEGVARTHREALP